jgi:hypothetical protein
VYVVAAEDPDAALKLVADKVVIGSDMKIVGRASRRLLDALGLKPGEGRPRLRSQARRAPHPADAEGNRFVRQERKSPDEV